MNATGQQATWVINMFEKKDALELLELLSAIESWSFSAKIPLPDYLFDKLDANIGKLRDIILQS